MTTAVSYILSINGIEYKWCRVCKGYNHVSSYKITGTKNDGSNKYKSDCKVHEAAKWVHPPVTVDGLLV